MRTKTRAIVIGVLMGASEGSQVLAGFLSPPTLGQVVCFLTASSAAGLGGTLAALPYAEHSRPNRDVR